MFISSPVNMYWYRSDSSLAVGQGLPKPLARVRFPAIAWVSSGSVFRYRSRFQKNTIAILESARTRFNLKATLIDLQDSDAVQNAPCAFGTFCIVHDGEVISHHPISNTRFENIMKRRVA